MVPKAMNFQFADWLSSKAEFLLLTWERQGSRRSQSKDSSTAPTLVNPFPGGVTLSQALNYSTATVLHL